MDGKGGICKRGDHAVVLVVMMMGGCGGGAKLVTSPILSDNGLMSTPNTRAAMPST